MEQKQNNFDGLRIVAAVMVLVSHQFALLQLPQPEIYSGMSLGGVAVLVFFSISGYLVAQSWTNDPNVVRFAAKRLLRVWPALAVATGVAALIVGPIVTSLPLRAYFAAPDFQSYFLMLRFRQWDQLPGVFDTLPFAHAVNGSLWTIPYEVRWYLFMMIAGALYVLRFRWALLAIVVALAVYHFGFYHAETNTDHDPLREFGLFFC